MKHKLLALLLTTALAGTLLAGCAGSKPEAENQTEESTAVSVVTDDSKEAPTLEDGTYTVDFDTDSGMFHVNEAMEGKGTLTVENGDMTVHISLVSKKILNLYPGLAEDAQKDGAVLLEPTLDTVTYSDGYTEEVFGFDVPVPYLEEEFDLALVGEKGTWYDHKVKVSDPEAIDPESENPESEDTEGTTLSEREQMVSVTLEGGSGKATVESPCKLWTEGDQYMAEIVWSSPYYDFMIVDGIQYDPVNEEGNSVFQIPVSGLGQTIEVQADTVAMSKPHLIDYTLTFAAETE